MEFQVKLNEKARKLRRQFAPQKWWKLPPLLANIPEIKKLQFSSFQVKKDD